MMVWTYFIICQKFLLYQHNSFLKSALTQNSTNQDVGENAHRGELRLIEKKEICYTILEK
jgi:hypothetical protein